MPEIVGDYVDRLCNTEMRMKGLPRGVTYPLYEKARQKQGAPLTYLAAHGLIERVENGDFVLLLTGAGMPPWLPNGETDGPLGAVSLARALAKGLGARPVYVSEERNLGPLIAASIAAGVSIVSRDDIVHRKEAALVMPFPLGEESAMAKAKELLDDFQPKAIISVEKTGPNEKGVFHTITGVEIPSDGQAHAYHLMEEADRRGILTIGIGDGGNELGYGLIVDDVREIQDYGKRCQCPCGSGVATMVSADVLVSAAVSNWGAYGVGACLAYMLEDTEILQDAHTEYRMLEACATAGALDGVYGNQILAVDGIDWRTQQSLITMLHSIVANGLKEFRRPF
jgi:hypothetical protein